jgi:hypothetical protein
MEIWDFKSRNAIIDLRLFLNKHKLITLIFLVSLLWQSNSFAQCDTGEVELYLTTSGGSYTSEKWVSITTGINGSGTVIWAQGDGSYGNGAGLVTNQSFCIEEGTTYYINAYDKYDDGWDGTIYEITDASSTIIANNSGNSPDNSTDDDSSSDWDTPAEELEVSEAFSYTAPPDPPDNDDCLNAQALTVGSSCSFSTYDNTGGSNSSAPTPGCANYSGSDVWFSVVVPASGSVVIDTDTGDITDGGMAAYSGTCGSLSLIECDDDDSDNGLMPKLELSGLTGGSTIYICFWEYGGDDEGEFDICAWEITCPDPSSLSASDITSSQASLSWDENGSSTIWDIELGEKGFSQTGVPTIDGTTSNPYTYTGLDAATEYEFYVRADCGSGDYSAWVGPFEFQTACETVTPPFNEDFDSYLPVCWTETAGLLAAPSTLSGESSFWGVDGFCNSGTTGAAGVNIYGISRDEWLITPSIDLGDGSTNYELSFDLALTDYNNSNPPENEDGTDDVFAVLISTDNGSTWTSANILQKWDNTSTPGYYDISTTGETITIDLSSFSGVIKIGFYAESTVANADNDLFIDNVSIEEVCTPPSITGTTPASRCGTGTVSLGATASSGTLNWYAASSGGSSLGTGASFTTPSISETTSYWVDATDGCTSERTEVIATVNNTPSTPGAISGTTNQCAGVTNQEYSIAAVSGADTYNWTVPTGWTISSGDGTTAIQVTTGAFGQDGNIEVTAENTCGESTEQSLAVSIVSAPSAPTANAASDASCTYFTANWSSVSGATGYYLDVATDAGFTSMVSGYNNLDVGNVTSQVVSGLSFMTTYYYRVRAYNACGTSVNSSTINYSTSSGPDAPTTNGDQSRCGSGTVTFTASGSTGNYLWYNAATEGALLASGSSFSPTVSTETEYWVAATESAPETIFSEDFSVLDSEWTIDNNGYDCTWQSETNGVCASAGTYMIVNSDACGSETTAGGYLPAMQKMCLLILV